MTLHPEEAAELRKKSLRGPRAPRERLERGIDTGWAYTEDHFFTKGDDYGQWRVADGRVWGPKNSGKYSVNNEGRILLEDKPTGFYIEEGRVYGPSPDLPWM